MYGANPRELAPAHPRTTRFAPSRPTALCTLVLVAVWPVSGAVSGYDLSGPRGTYHRLTVPAAEALRWSSEAWGPGETLVWHIDGDDPDWQHWYGSAEGAIPVVAAALAAWSDIETADISWRLDGLLDLDEEAARRGRRNFVYINEDHRVSGAAWTWEKQNGSGRWETYQCVVYLGKWASEAPPDWWQELDENHPEREFPGSGTLVHEFGHCLQLGHAQTFPGRNWFYDAPTSRYTSWTHSDGVWPDTDPVMAYGRGSFESPLTADDRVGASLLRPRPGWLSGTGGISGRVHQENGEPVVYAHVWAFPNAGGTRHDGVGVFSDWEGGYVIEGLAPGDYTLWVSPLTEQSAKPGLHRFVSEDWSADWRETVLPHPVGVRAGRVTDGVDIGLRKGRNCRSPFPCEAVR